MKTLAVIFFALALLVAGCMTRRQLVAIQPGMTMAEFRTIFGEPDQTSNASSQGTSPAEATWYYNAYRAKEVFEWRTIPTMQPPGWQLEPGRATVGVRYRRFEIVFRNGVVVSRTEYAPAMP